MFRVSSFSNRDDDHSAYVNQPPATDHAPNPDAYAPSVQVQRPTMIHLVMTFATGIVLGGAAIVSMDRDDRTRAPQEHRTGQTTFASTSDTADRPSNHADWVVDPVVDTGGAVMTAGLSASSRTQGMIDHPVDDNASVVTIYLVEADEKAWEMQKLLGEGDAIRVSLGVPPLPPTDFVSVGTEALNGLTQLLIEALHRHRVRVVDARTP